MQFKIFISIILIMIMPAFSIMANEVNTQTDVEQEKEYDKQSDNLQLIVNYCISHQLVKYIKPNIKSTDKFKLTAYRIRDELNYNHLPSDEMIKAIRNYKDVYLVDFESKAIKLKILYSLTNSKITLISSYKLNKDKWQKLEGK